MGIRRTESDTRLGFLRALLAENPSELGHWLTAGGRVPVEWLDAQGIASYAFGHLREAGLIERLPADAHLFLRQNWYQGTAANLVQRRDMKEVLETLDQDRVDMVLLKGAPLAYTIYDDPSYRLRGDLDVWVHPDQVQTAARALQAMGYQSREKSDRPVALTDLVGGELHLFKDRSGASLVELQWPALRGEWVRRTAAVDHAALWNRRVPVQIEGRTSHALCPEDCLIHLCVHHAINHQFSQSWVRNLLDIHLVIQRLRPDWGQVVATARAWRTSVACWTVLDLAARLLGVAVPSEVLAGLAPPTIRQQSIGALQLDRQTLEMGSVGYGYRRFLIELLLADRMRDAIRLVLRGLFPEAPWLAARYSAHGPTALWRARFLHPWRLLTSART